MHRLLCHPQSSMICTEPRMLRLPGLIARIERKRIIPASMAKLCHIRDTFEFVAQLLNCVPKRTILITEKHETCRGIEPPHRRKHVFLEGCFDYPQTKVPICSSCRHVSTVQRLYKSHWRHSSYVSNFHQTNYNMFPENKKTQDRKWNSPLTGSSQ